MRRLKYGLAVIPVIFLNLFFIFSQAALAADPPKITDVLPKTVAVSTDDLRVRIRGTNFTKDSVVLINNTPLPKDQVKKQNKNLLAIIPGSLLAQPGTVSVAVMNADGSVTKTLTVSVIPASNVLITGIRPRVVVAGQVSQAFGVIAQGSNYDGNAVVRVGGLKTTSVITRKGDFSIITGTVDPKEVEFAGSVPIQVENTDGTLSNTFNIIITPPGPALTSLDPGSVDVGSAQTTIL